MKYAAVVLTVVLLTSSANAQCSGSYNATGSNNPNWSVQWTVRENMIDFNVTAQTTGWVGIGFSENTMMTDSDVVVGAANDNNTMYYVSDRWVGTERVAPTVDENQDLTMTMAEQINGWTTISFTRARTTNDEAPVDVSLENAVYLLWATGNEISFDGSMSNSIMYHATSRGASGSSISFTCPDSTGSAAGIFSITAGSISVLIMSAIASVLATMLHM